MSGHSKWNNIKRKKEKTDAQKGKIFTKIGREIAVAVSQGGPDPGSNSKLKDVISKAKANNVPNSNIESMIKKAVNSNSGVNCESLRYEGYGPGNVAFIVEVLTDNKNRTSSNMRHYFDKYGGSLGSPGCVSFMFDERGEIVFDKDKFSEDDWNSLMDAVCDSGASDFHLDDSSLIVECEKSNFENVKRNLSNKGFDNFMSELSMIPSFYQKIEDEEVKQKVLNFVDILENDDDVQEVWSNCSSEDDSETEYDSTSSGGDS